MWAILRELIHGVPQKPDSRCSHQPCDEPAAYTVTIKSDTPGIMTASFRSCATHMRMVDLGQHVTFD